MRLICWLFCFFALNVSAYEKVQDVIIENSMIRMVPPTATVSAGFMVIKNNTNKDIKLIKVEGSISKTIELHSMVLEGETMKMRKMDTMEIKAKSSLELKRKSFHLMFIDLLKPLKLGDNHKLKFTFDNKTVLEIPISVQEIN